MVLPVLVRLHHAFEVQCDQLQVNFADLAWALSHNPGPQWDRADLVLVHVVSHPPGGQPGLIHMVKTEIPESRQDCARSPEV